MTAATYDGTGLRASATTGSGSQAFTWNTTGQIPELLMDSTNAYIYGTGVAPAEQVNLSTGAISYLTTDSLGSVRGTVNSTGTLTGTTAYDAWGNPQTTGGLTAATPFGYAGGYADPTGMLYLINRYYDPQTGQFTSVDPAVAQTMEPYGYANGNPVSNADPTGMCSWWDSRCWEFWVLRGSLYLGAVAFAGLAAWFCDDVTAGVCGILNGLFFRAAFASAAAIAACWWFRWCHGFWDYLDVGVVAFLAALVTGGLARVFRKPAKLLSFRIWVVWHYYRLVDYFKI
jgi:RHS repeat-associated protein